LLGRHLRWTTWDYALKQGAQAGVAYNEQGRGFESLGAHEFRQGRRRAVDVDVYRTAMFFRPLCAWLAKESCERFRGDFLSEADRSPGGGP
ncbi:MAG: hypothetical protein ACRDZR_10855, partial [Acidimicrobiales bacterium]